MRTKTKDRYYIYFSHSGRSELVTKKNGINTAKAMIVDVLRSSRATTLDRSQRKTAMAYIWDSIEEKIVHEKKLLS